MANLRTARRNLYAIGAILIVIDIAAVLILLSPASANSLAKQDEFNSLRQQVQNKAKSVVPPDQAQRRVDEARQQIDDFTKNRIPSEISDLSLDLGKLASDAGVHLANVQYGSIDSDIPGLTRYRISASIAGDYLATVKFINALERAKHFYVLNSINLGEQQGGSLHVGLVLDTYVKEAA
jgi:Tfp pilus assembly protein PilO